MVERVPNLRHWFGADELETCGRCGQNTALKVHTDRWIICTECGPVDRDFSLHAALPHGADLEPTAG